MVTNVTQKNGKQLNFEKINVKNRDLVRIRSLYEASFPSDERRDFSEFLRLMKDDAAPFHVVALSVSGSFAGFITYWEWQDFRYFEHFAIEVTMRNGGIGFRALQAVVGASPLPVVLEVELPDTEMARRRILFYERCGFRLWDNIDYMQPSYGTGKNAMPLRLMTCGNMSFAGPDDEKILRIKKVVYGVEA